MEYSNGWTMQRRRKLSRDVHRWKPWLRSTGPRTAAGKAVSSRNAFKGGVRPLMRKLARALREQRLSLAAVDQAGS